MASTYADPDIRTTPAGTYRHPRHYARVTDGPPPPPAPGEQLRDWRHRNCLNQAQVGRLAAAPTWQISRWERGLDPMPPGVLTRIARAHRQTSRTTR